MEALRESRASREAAQAVATGSKVVLTPKQQSAFGACRHGRKEELTELLAAGGILCTGFPCFLALNFREARERERGGYGGKNAIRGVNGHLRVDECWRAGLRE